MSASGERLSGDPQMVYVIAEVSIGLVKVKSMRNTCPSSANITWSGVELGGVELCGVELGGMGGQRDLRELCSLDVVEL